MNFLQQTIKYVLMTIVMTTVNPSLVKSLPVNLETQAREIFIYDDDSSSLLSTDENVLPHQDTAIDKNYYGKIMGEGIRSYRYDGKEAFVQYLKFSHPINISSQENKHIWIRVKGKAYQQTKNNNLKHNYIDVNDYEIINMESNLLTQIVDDTCQFITNNLKNIDLNEYKNTKRFQTAFKDLAEQDFNQIEYVPIKEIAFQDYHSNYLGIHCGKSIMRENLQRGDFLSYLAIYNLTNNSLEKVIVKNTGYFLE